MKLKLVRAKRQCFWDGHRRRAGAVFPVREDVNESFLEDVGDAPEGAELPSQIQNVQAPRGKSFAAVMEEQGRQDIDDVKPVKPDFTPKTLAEAQEQDLVG